MCGIAGFHDSRLRPDERGPALVEMVRTLFHRGPDSEGHYLHGGSGLGMRRLRIIDLATGDPPIFNEKGDVCVVFNGEIYNHRFLRQGLEARGHCFATRTDTEVIVHLYEERGERFVEELRGMFAIALLDTARGRLVLARDRIGIKPLYYATLGDGTLLFGSELKAILAYPQAPREIDPVALNAFLAYSYIPDPLTIFRRIRKLLPGHFLVAEADGAVRDTRYWDIGPDVDEETSAGGLADRLRGAIEDAVGCHLESDVPLGAFLSGGVDSSAIVATIARISGRPPKTYSIGFTEAAFDERRYARLVAEQYRTEHHEEVQELAGIDSVERLLPSFDEPFADASLIPTHLVSEFARRQITVALSGDGGDELFAGYGRYEAILRHGFVDMLPLDWRRRTFSFLQRFYPAGWRGWRALGYLGLSPMERNYTHLQAFTDTQKAGSLYTPEFLAELGSFDSRELFEPYYRPGWDALRQLTYLDVKTYLPGDILTKVDRMSMAHALEVRVPLLDHRVVETAFRIPSRYHLRNGRTKRLFHEVVDPWLPDEIRRRPKKGFAIPVGEWLVGPSKARIREVLLSAAASGRGYLNAGPIARLWNEHQSRVRNHYVRLWVLYCLELWFGAAHGQHVRPITPRPEAASAPRL